MKYYTVIDTNVLVSAMLKWNSVPGNIMELAFSGPIIPVLNEDIVKEYREVLLRPKFHLTEEIVNDVLDTINEKGIYVDADTIDIELPDPRTGFFMRLSWKNAKRKTHTLLQAISNIFQQSRLL